jgi:hypothetical protein
MRLSKTVAKWTPATFAWATWLIMLALALAYVAHFSSNAPYQDEWHSVAVLTGYERLTPTWLWSQHNEHRIPLPRLLHCGLYHLAGKDFRGAMYTNVLALGALAAGLILAARSVRGWTNWDDAFFPLIILHWGQGYNLLFGYQILVMAPVCLSGIILMVIARTHCQLRPGMASLAGVCLLLLPLCGGLGLVWVPGLAFWLGLAVARTETCTTDRAVKLIGAGSAVGSLALLGAYFLGFDRSYTPPVPGLWPTVRTVLEFLSTAFGTLQALMWYVAAAIVLLACSIAAASAVLAFIRRPSDRVQALGFLAILAGVLVEALAVGWGRAGLGPSAGLAQRYSTMTAIGIACAYLASLVYQPGGVGAGLRHLLFVVALCMLWPNTLNGISYGRELRTRFEQFEFDVRRGVPPSILANQYTRSPSLLGRAWRKKQFGRELAMLRDAGVGWFQFLRDDPDWLEIPLAQPATKSAGLSYSLPQARFVYAVRLMFKYEPGPAFADLKLTWKEQPGSAPSTFRITLPRTGQDDVLLAWLDSPVSQLFILPGDIPPRCQISDVTLLVP